MLKLHKEWLEAKGANRVSIDQGQSGEFGFEYEVLEDQENLLASGIMAFQRFGRQEVQVEVSVVRPDMFIVEMVVYDHRNKTLTECGNCVSWTGVLDADMPWGCVGIKKELPAIEVCFLPFVGEVIAFFKRTFPSINPREGLESLVVKRQDVERQEK